MMALLSEQAISQYDYEALRAQRQNQPTSSQAEDLVLLLLRKSEKAFFVFVKELRKTGQAHLAKLLHSEGEELRFYTFFIMVK